MLPALALLRRCTAAGLLLAAAAAAAAEAPKISEWQLPAPMFARALALSSEGMLFIAVPNDNRVVRFDPRTQAFRDWELPSGHHPNALTVDRNGAVWSTGYGNSSIGRLRPAGGMIAEFATPTPNGSPHSLVLSDDGETLWFTMQSASRIGSLDTATGRIAEFEDSGKPTGITIDRGGAVWWCRSAETRLGRLDPQSGKISDLELGRGNRPRRIASAPDGMLWVTIYGRSHVLRVNPQTQRVLRSYALPPGSGEAHSIAIDATGVVWISEMRNDTLLRLDPAAPDAMQTIRLPFANTGVRPVISDGSRIWYGGTRSGRFGFVQ